METHLQVGNIHIQSLILRKRLFTLEDLEMVQVRQRFTHIVTTKVKHLQSYPQPAVFFLGVTPMLTGQHRNKGFQPIVEVHEHLFSRW